jgi:hypothetical protein
MAVLTIKDSDVEDVNKSLQVGDVSYLSKADVSREELLAIVNQRLQKQV